MVINVNLDKKYYFMHLLLGIKIYINYLRINNTIIIIVNYSLYFDEILRRERMKIARNKKLNCYLTSNNTVEW